MILRLSQKLSTKIKAGTLKAMPLDENPYADWSCHLFTVDRTQYILVSNTKSLYSCVLYGKGITNDYPFIQRVLSSLREFMARRRAVVYLPEVCGSLQRHGQFCEGLESFGHRVDERPDWPCDCLVGIRRHCSTRPWLPAERHSVVGNRHEKIGQVRKAE